MRTSHNGFRRWAVALQIDGTVLSTGKNSWAEHDSVQSVSGIMAGVVGEMNDHVCLWPTSPLVTTEDAELFCILADRVGAECCPYTVDVSPEAEKVFEAQRQARCD